MGYDCVNVIKELVKQDGLLLEDKNALLEYVRSNSATFAESLNISWKKVYPGRIASIILIGLRGNVNNNTITPYILDINPTKFVAALSGSGQRINSYESGRNYYSEDNPVSSNYNKDLKVCSMNLTSAELKNMLPMKVPFPVIRFGASTSVSTLCKPSIADCWTDHDKQYAGYTDSATKDAYEASGITDYAHLFYTVHLIDELSARYGYRLMDPTRPYSPFNWVKIVDTIDGSTATMPMYKVMFLTEFDLYAHSGMIESPNMLTSTFVKSNIFSKMIQSMVSYSTDQTLTGTPTDNTSYHYLQRMHSTLLSSGDILISGQYIYSKDFAYKLQLHLGGQLFVWKLPVTAGGLDTPFLNVLPPGPWSRKKDNFVACCLWLQPDRNIVVYCNPIVTVTYDKVNVSNTPIVSFSAGGSISHTGTYADSYASLSSGYNVVITPGGAFVMASPGINQQKNTVSVLSGSNQYNMKRSAENYDTDCINGYSYVGSDGKSVLSSDIVSTTTKDSNGKPWCYASIFVKPNKYTTNGMEFDDANLQLIVYQTGMNNMPDKVYDVAYNLFNGSFMEKAKSLGFVLDGTVYKNATFAYCMRGDRWATVCNSSMLSISRFGLQPSLSEFSSDQVSAAKYKITKQLCADNYDAKYNELCAIVAPRDIMIQSLIKIDPAFGVLSNPTSATYRPYTAPVEETMMKYKSFTVPQMEYLYTKIGRSSAARTYWNQLYASITGLTPFGIQDFTTFKSGAYKFYTQPLLVAMPTVLIVLKTESAGLFFGAGEMDFPYVSNAQLTYSKDDPFWARLMLSTIQTDGQWIDRSFLPCTTLDISGAMGPDGYNKLLLQPYDTIQLQITGAATSANAIVYMKSVSIPKVVAYVRATSTYGTADLTGTICEALPEACYEEALRYVQSNPFNTVSNKWCDVASSTSGAYMSSKNKSSLANACNSAYGTIFCMDPKARYKTGFTVTPSQQPMFVNAAEHLQERFSTSCVDACAQASIGDALYDACRIGAVAYCSTNDNIITDTCIQEAKRYTEVDDVRKRWCNTSANTTNANYASYCPDAPEHVAMSAISEAPQGTFTKNADSTNETTSGTNDSTSSTTSVALEVTPSNQTINESDNPPRSQTSSTQNPKTTDWFGMICVFILIAIIVGVLGLLRQPHHRKSFTSKRTKTWFHRKARNPTVG